MGSLAIDSEPIRARGINVKYKAFISRLVLQAPRVDNFRARFTSGKENSDASKLYKCLYGGGCLGTKSLHFNRQILKIDSLTQFYGK